jgi:Fe-S-cluster containining protein
MTDIKFDCNGCGKCCEGNISLTYNEFLKHKSNFGFILSYSFQKVSKEFAKKNQKKYIIKKINNNDIIIVPEILTMTSNQPCINLDENKMCSIYLDRPKVCALYPVRLDTMLDGIETALIKERNNSLIEKNSSVKCEGWENTNNLIFKGNSLTNTNDLNILKLRKKEEKNTNIILILYFEEILKEKRINHKINSQEKGVIITKIYPFSKFLEKNKLIGKKEVKRIKQGQIKSNNKLINILKLKQKQTNQDNDLIDFALENISSFK